MAVNHLSIKKIFLFAAILISAYHSKAQKKSTSNTTIINTASFENSAHHWYDIYDKSNVVNAKPHQPRYAGTNITAIGDNILLYQKDNGGWPKNYDMLAILTPAQQDSIINAKKYLNTTFDNSLHILT